MLTPLNPLVYQGLSSGSQLFDCHLELKKNHFWAPTQIRRQERQCAVSEPPRPPDPVMLVMLRQEIRGIQRAQSNFYGRKWVRAPVMTNKPSYIIVRHAWMNLQKHAGVISAYISVFGVTCLGSWFGTPRVFRTVPQNSIHIHALQYTVKSNILYIHIYIYISLRAIISWKLNFRRIHKSRNLRSAPLCPALEFGSVTCVLDGVTSTHAKSFRCCPVRGEAIPSYFLNDPKRPVVYTCPFLQQHTWHI